MRVIGTEILDDAMRKHSSVSRPLSAWLSETRSAQWKTPNQLKERYPSASVIRNNRVVFNIKGNDFRLVTAINYRSGIVDIRFIDTHAEYDKINASEI